MPDFSTLLVIGNSENRRVQFFREAAEALGLAPIQVISYESLLAGTIRLGDHLQPGALVRLESPGENATVERGLMSLGAETPTDREWLASFTREDLERGRIGPSRLWFQGYSRLLASIKTELAGCPVTVMNHPEEVRLMFSKLECQQRLQQAGLPIPPLLGPVESYDQLRTLMTEQQEPRCFLKLLHGSSASGVIALQASARTSRVQAITTVDLAQRNGEPVLWNSLRLREYHGERDVAQLIDALAVHGLYAERWIPKITFGGGPCDLRIVVIDGEERHMVVRIGRGPLTNLHLGNQRGRIEEFLATRVPSPAVWESAMRTVRRVATLFPRTLYFGLDFACTASFRAHALFEVNAYGDLLPNILDRNTSTSTAELLAIQNNPAPYSTTNWHAAEGNVP